MGRGWPSASFLRGVQPMSCRRRTTTNGSRPWAIKLHQRSIVASPCGASSAALMWAGRMPLGPGSAPATSASKR
eukprot:10160521-Lingulodinium_polyedra.AAC.1